MGPKPTDERSDHDLFRTELVNLIDQRHELVKLAELIDWQAFADKWSHEDVVERWCENPYWVRRRNRHGVGGASPLQE